MTAAQRNALYEAAMRALETPAARAPQTKLMDLSGEWLTVISMSEREGRKGKHVFTLTTDHGEITGIPAKYVRVLNQPDVCAYVNSDERPPFLVAFTYELATEDGKRGHWTMSLDVKQP